MAGEKGGTITSSDDGTQVPDSNGFSVNGPFQFEIVNGTTLNATLQKLSSQGNWVTQPDPDSRTTLTGADSFKVDCARGGRFRINVTTATGTWDWSAVEY